MSLYSQYVSTVQGVFVGGEENLPWLLMRQTIPETEIVVDPCAAFLVLVVTALLCIGIREVWFQILYPF